MLFFKETYNKCICQKKEKHQDIAVKSQYMSNHNISAFILNYNILDKDMDCGLKSCTTFFYITFQITCVNAQQLHG